MQYREDQRALQKLSILGMGCMRLPAKLGRIDIEKSEAIIMEAIRLGVNYFDTAYIYLGSEAALGQILSRNNARERVFIATKLPLMLCRNAEDFEKFFRTQLERLQTDHIDYYLLHMLGSPKQWQKLCNMGIQAWIEQKKSAKQIQQIGFSFHGQQDDFLALLDAYDWDFCQIQYNYINTQYQAGLAGLTYVAKKGLPVIIMEPLLGGKLATGLPPNAVERLREADASISPAAWALRWLWDQPEPTVVLSGMSELPQIIENAELAQNAAPGMLTATQHQAIKDVVTLFETANKVPCTGCNYCMPCPQHVNIPACFSVYNSSFVYGRQAGLHQYTTATAIMTPKPGNAARCIQCGACEPRCPQGIPIRDRLRDVKTRLEPFWFSAAISVARRVTRQHKP